MQALPKGVLPFKVSLPQSSTLQVGGKAHFALQNDHFAETPNPRRGGFRAQSSPVAFRSRSPVPLCSIIPENTPPDLAGSSGCVPRPCAAPWLREGGNLMIAAMHAARILYHPDIHCISCVCESVRRRLCCPRPVGSQVPSALQEGLASTATHPTRGCAFSGRIRRVDTAARR